MKILLNNNDLNEALYDVSNLGFVPTMGSLHKGHISLIEQSIKDRTIFGHIKTFQLPDMLVLILRGD